MYLHLYNVMVLLQFDVSVYILYYHPTGLEVPCPAGNSPTTVEDDMVIDLTSVDSFMIVADENHAALKKAVDWMFITTVLILTLRNMSVLIMFVTYLPPPLTHLIIVLISYCV